MSHSSGSDYSLKKSTSSSTDTELNEFKSNEFQNLSNNEPSTSTSINNNIINDKKEKKENLLPYSTM